MLPYRACLHHGNYHNHNHCKHFGINVTITILIVSLSSQSGIAFAICSHLSPCLLLILLMWPLPTVPQMPHRPTNISFVAGIVFNSNNMKLLVKWVSSRILSMQCDHSHCPADATLPHNQIICNSHHVYEWLSTRGYDTNLLNSLTLITWNSWSKKVKHKSGDDFFLNRLSFEQRGKP